MENENTVLTTSQVKAEETLATITNRINTVMDGVNSATYEVCGLLLEASKVVGETEYKSLGEYAEKNFGIGKARASQMKTIAERFLEKKSITAKSETGEEVTIETYVCKLPVKNRNWGVDNLYLLGNKLSDEEINKLITDGTITSDTTVSAVREYFKPKKDDKPKLENKSEEPKSEEPKSEEPKSEEPKSEEPKSEEPKSEEPKSEEPKSEEPKEDVWNTELAEIFQLASFIKEILDQHAGSKVSKLIEKSVDRIIELSDME